MQIDQGYKIDKLQQYSLTRNDLGPPKGKKKISDHLGFPVYVKHDFRHFREKLH